MNIVGIIPARMGSSRLPGKPLMNILNMSMLEHCFRRCAMAVGFESTYVVTPDEEIISHVESFGGKALLTSHSHTRAVSRTAEGLEILLDYGENIDGVVMVQGDEPLVSPNTIKEAFLPLNDEKVNIANTMIRFRNQNDFNDINNIKVVTDKDNNAMYYSREPIPSKWQGWNDGEAAFMQIGIIAFRNEALLKYQRIEETPLEIIEGTDMNRMLENGDKIRMILSDTFTIGVDTANELKRTEEIMKDDPTYFLYKNH